LDKAATARSCQQTKKLANTKHEKQVSDFKDKKAKRLQRTANVIKKQMRIAKAFGLAQLLKQPHRLAKQHALDCGNPKCLVCHSEKVFRKPTLQEKRFDQSCKTDNLDS
jgi:hypothetical protein